MAAVASHSRACVVTSSARADGFFSRHLAKYLPVTSSTSGDDASQICVRAPFSGVSRKGEASAKRKPKKPRFERPKLLVAEVMTDRRLSIEEQAPVNEPEDLVA